jgi:mRNA interferase MazF
MRRGEIWEANLNPTRGAEAGKISPVLVLQADWLTEQGARTVVALPLSTKVRSDTGALRLTIKAREHLKMDSYVIVEKIRAVDRSRFGEGPLAHVDEAELAVIEQQLRAVLGML